MQAQPPPPSARLSWATAELVPSNAAWKGKPSYRKVVTEVSAEEAASASVPAEVSRCDFRESPPPASSRQMARRPLPEPWTSVEVPPPVKGPFTRRVAGSTALLVR